MIGRIDAAPSWKEGLWKGKASSEIRYAFVGGGIIATAFIERVITTGAAGADRIVATDNRAEHLSYQQAVDKVNEAQRKVAQFTASGGSH